MLEKSRHSERLDLRKSVGFIEIPGQLISELMRYLNGAKKVKDKNIVGILERLLELERIGPKKVDRPIPTYIALRRKIRQLESGLSELNRELKRYQFRPWVVPHYGPNWYVGRWGVIWYSGRPGREPLQAGEALDTIFDLARAGHLPRLKRCTHCRNWLYARFRHQTFCSTKCQQKHYSETDAFKAHRRKYMRGWYHQQFGPRKSRRND